MNRIVALLIAGSLLLTAVAPVAAINDGTSNTRGGAAARGCATAGQHEAPVHAGTREGGKVCIVPSGKFSAPRAR